MSEPRQPTRFELTGEPGVSVTYDTTTITGRPQLSYRDGYREVTRSGDEIGSDETRLGTLVTVELAAQPDRHVIELSLVVPTVNVGEDPAAFETIAIETTVATPLGGPGTVAGAVQTYRVLRLQGTAQLVVS